MNWFASLSSQPLFQCLGLTLLEFLWQGTLVALIWGAVRTMLARARPSARYAVGCAALAAMIAMPCWTFLTTQADDSDRPLPERFASASGGGLSASDAGVPLSRATPSALETVRNFGRKIEPWPVVIWAAGVALLCLRFLSGWATVARLTRSAEALAPESLRRALTENARAMRVLRPVRLLQSAAIQVPTALGVLRPAILLPLSGLTGLSTRQIEALIAHELAHVRRHDYLINLFQTAVETLLFYHPAVWWISANVRLERESCCDDLAVESTGDAGTYARALLRLEEERAGRVHLALAATGGSLLARVRRLFPRFAGEPPANPARAGALLALAAIVLLGAAAGGPSPTDAFGGAIAGSFAADSPALVSPTPARELETSPRDRTMAFNRVSPSPVRSRRPASETPSEFRASSARTLTDEDLEDFRIHGVTADFLREIETLGYTRASPATLVSLKTHGVTTDYLRRMNELFGQRISLDAAIDLRNHGVVPEYLSEMSRIFGKLTPDAVESLRTHGVSPEYVTRFRDQGYGSLSADDAILMRNHGVDPAAASEFVKMGFPKPTLDELLSARNHGVSVEYVRGMRETGIGIGSLEVMVSLRNHGVTPEYLKGMKEQGFAKLSSDDAITLRDHGVTPEYVRELRLLGYNALSVDETVALRNHGITGDFIRKTNSSAGKRLSVDELIEARIWRRSER